MRAAPGWLGDLAAVGASGPAPAGLVLPAVRVGALWAGV